MRKSTQISTPYEIFIIGGNESFRKVLSYHLGLNPDHIVANFTDSFFCINEAVSTPDLIIIDDNLSDAKQNVLIDKLKAENPSMAVIILTHNSENKATNRFKKMDIDMFIERNLVTKSSLWDAVSLVKNSKKRSRVTSSGKTISKKQYSATIKGESKQIHQVFKLMDRAVQSDINVSITGQTGTGKELVAKAIHNHSIRKAHKFVAINMAAIPKDLVESELFGYEKGAFTGAHYSKKGKFEEADGGTLFLDEIAELDMHLQSKILRVLQEKEISRIGSNEVVKLNFRLIIASHKELIYEVEKGNFREDLYYRIMGLTIKLPPLKQRIDDILCLAEYFLKQFCFKNNMLPVEIAKCAQKKLLHYNYPGNIRELKSVIEIAAVMCIDSQIKEDDIQFRKIKAAYQYTNEPKTLKEYTRDIVNHYLKMYKNNVMETARVLNIGKSTIYKMIQTNEIKLHE